MGNIKYHTPKPTPKISGNSHQHRRDSTSKAIWPSIQLKKQEASLMHLIPQREMVHNGFTLSEMIITTAIVGMLSTIALPKYVSQVDRSSQNEASSVVSQIQTTIATYADEFGVLPSSWKDLNDISAIMTETGPATQNNFGQIKIANGAYSTSIAHSGNLFTISATNSKSPKLNVIGCVNLTNGASGINKGTSAAAATTPNCGS